MSTLEIRQDAINQLRMFFEEWELDMNKLHATYNDICRYFHKTTVDWADVYNYMTEVF